MTFPITDKSKLRAAMRRQRRDYAASHAPETRWALEEALADALVPLFATAGIAAAYAPMKDEISPSIAMDCAFGANVIAAYPFFVDRDSRMTFRVGTPVDPGPWGILQPAPDSAIVSPDLILMPLVAVDRAGNRVGMGKGHYDRALRGLREAGARLIGCGWDFQLLDEELAPDPWDVPLDGFASPDGLRMFR
jgi:5-formyltetrahydrofolate cyclo-ligase